MLIQGNYPNFTALKAALGAKDAELGFYDNDKSLQCWITNSEAQICITIPKNSQGRADLDPKKPVVVQSSVREFTIEKKLGQTFVALWVFNGYEEKNKEVLDTF